MRILVLVALGATSVGCAASPSPAIDTAADRAAVERAVSVWFDSGLAVGDTVAVVQGLTASAAILEDSVWYDRAGFVKLVQSIPQIVAHLH